MSASESLESWIVRRLSGSLGIPIADIDPAAPFTRLGIDSMVLIGFAAELERHLDQAINPAIFLKYSSPRALARHLKGES
jgi:acyl carrier protein